MTLHRCSTVLRVAVVAVLALLAARTGGAQQDTTLAPTPTLLRRIAEAVDGHRTGERVWIVASHDSLNPVRQVLTDRASALALARRLGPRHGVFGPYQTVRDARAAMIIIGCRHDPFSSMDQYCPMPLFALTDVDSMTLVIHRRGGRSHPVPIGRRADAIFLTLPALDKFAIPYYSRVIGVEAAATMRADIVRRIDRQTASVTPSTDPPGTRP